MDIGGGRVMVATLEVGGKRFSDDLIVHTLSSNWREKGGRSITTIALLRLACRFSFQVFSIGNLLMIIVSLWQSLFAEKQLAAEIVFQDYFVTFPVEISRMGVGHIRRVTGGREFCTLTLLYRMPSFLDLLWWKELLASPSLSGKRVTALYLHRAR